MVGGYSRITVKSEAGRPDSLKRPVRIAFISSPCEPNGPSHPYSLVACYIRDFDVGTTSARVVCGPMPMGDSGSRFQLNLRTTSGKILTTGSAYAAPLAAGQVASLNATSTWNVSALQNNEIAPQRASFSISNKSASKQEVSVGPQGCMWHIVYHPVEIGRSITVPCYWTLQAYVVDDSVTEKTILQPEDLMHPIFPKAIPLDPLPADSTWTLSQDNDGTIRINNDEYNPVKAVAKPVNAVAEPVNAVARPVNAVAEPVKALAEPVTKKDPLSEVLERLTTIEKSIVQMQDDYTLGQKAMVDMRTQLSALERVAATKEEVKESRAEFNRNVAAVEAKADMLAGSFDQNQERLSAVRKTVGDTQTLLAGVEKSTQDQLHDLKRQLPVVQSKAETAVTSTARSHDRLSALEDSTGRAQERLTTVENAVRQTQNQVSVVQQLIASNTQLLAMKPNNTGGTIPEPSSLSERPPLDQDNRSTVVEARVDKLEKSVGEQRKVLKAMDRRTQAELVAIRALVAGLDSRVSAIETSSDGDEAGVGDLSPSASTETSPVMFPNHLVDGPAVS